MTDRARRREIFRSKLHFSTANDRLLDEATSATVGLSRAPGQRSRLPRPAARHRRPMPCAADEVTSRAPSPALRRRRTWGWGFTREFNAPTAFRVA